MTIDIGIRMKKQDNKEEKKISLMTNPGLPNLFVDDLHVTMRNDGLATLGFYSLSADASYEHVKITTPIHRLRAMADLINSQLEKFDKREDEALSADSKKVKR